MVILLGYVYLIALMKDIHRVFQYHGAEHKSIYTFEAGEELAGVHAGLDNLGGHLAAERLLLLGDENQAHAAFADLFKELVGADKGAGAL